MASTPELSSPSSFSSSDDGSPFFSPLSISAFPPLQISTSVSPEPSDTAICADAFRPENLPSPYTLHHVYPDPSKTTHFIPDISFKKAASISGAQSNIPDSDVALSAKPRGSLLQHRPGRSGSLPQSLDGKLHRPSHPSFVKFPETLPLNKSQLHGLRSPHPCCISGTRGTEALISLAWTGEVSSPMVASGYAPSRIGDTYMWPKLRISEAEVAPTRRASWPGKSDGQGAAREFKNTQQQPHCSPVSDSQINSQTGRWTLANAISDDEVTDETLVELLEEFRSRRLRSTKRSTFRFLPDILSPTEEIPGCTDTRPPGGVSIPPRLPDIIPADVSRAWSTARRAVLVCRELILTERHYLSSLNALLAGKTRSPPPPLMITRLPALVNASNRLFDLMEANPSVMGVCTAFIQIFEQLEEAFIQWCEVVGQFFSTDRDGSPGALVKRSNSVPATPSSVAGRKGAALLTKSVGSWSKRIHSKAINLEEIALMVARNPKGKPQLKPLTRDLAILPTQRITRYVLLFKDLLFHSPPLDIKSTVERATEAAITLAEKADRAQDHAAFRMAPST